MLHNRVARCSKALLCRLPGILAFAFAFVLLAVSASAAPLLGEYDVIEGNTYIQIFSVAEAAPDVKDFWIEWKESSRNVMALGGSGSHVVYYFLVIPENGNFTFEDYGGRLLASGTEGFRFVSFVRDGGKLVPEGVTDVPAGMKYSFQYIVTGTYWDDTYSWPVLSYDYLVDGYPGALVLVDDLEEGPSPPPDSGEGWLGNLLDGIKNILKDFFLPSDDYLSGWYDEIRDASSEKFGAIFELYEILREAGSSLEASGGGSSSFIWSIPANKMFEGSPAISVDVFETAVPYFSKLKGWFTVIIVITTAIICYRRIVAVFEF